MQYNIEANYECGKENVDNRHTVLHSYLPVVGRGKQKEFETVYRLTLLPKVIWRIPKEVNEKLKVVICHDKLAPFHHNENDEIPYRSREKGGTDLCAITFNSIVFGQAADIKSTSKDFKRKDRHVKRSLTMEHSKFRLGMEI